MSLDWAAEVRARAEARAACDELLDRLVRLHPEMPVGVDTRPCTRRPISNYSPPQHANRPPLAAEAGSIPGVTRGNEQSTTFPDPFQ